MFCLFVILHSGSCDIDSRNDDSGVRGATTALDSKYFCCICSAFFFQVYYSSFHGEVYKREVWEKEDMDCFESNSCSFGYFWEFLLDGLGV